MNRILGMCGAAMTALCVASFALCMIFSLSFGGYFVCIFLSLGYVMITGALTAEAKAERKAAAYMSVAFAAVYCTLILIVYFTQTTSVRLDSLNEQAMQVLNYKESGLFFNLDLLGYGIMALSTFFAGLSIKAENKVDKWLKWLLIIHGAFFLSCLILPMLGVFSSNTEEGALTGVIALEFWCVYFLPICVLSFFHFRRAKQ